MKILLAGSGTGKGVAMSNATKKKYMKVIGVQAGLGIGIKKFRLVWVFENQKDLDAFINSGW
jgi:lipid-binding SYLF domain-containing protein